MNESKLRAQRFYGDVMQRVDLEHDSIVKFVAMDPTPGGGNLGRAEFSFCMRYNRGKLEEMTVTPLQQRDAKNYYVLKNGTASEIIIGSFTHKGLQEPKVWRTGWCKEHKGPFMEVYVPTASNIFHVHNLSSVSITFDRI